MENSADFQKRLKTLFVYDPLTGVFTRRIASGRHGCHPAGEACGTINAPGYVIMGVDGCRYVAHRLAWVYVYGRWPVGDLDHINQQKADNRIANLREASRAQNMQNVSLHRHNSSGRKGVCWHKVRAKWRAYIFNGYRQQHLGLFTSFADAVQAREAAEREQHTHRVADDVEAAAAQLEAVMVAPPAWAAGLPLAAEVNIRERYGK
jgi:hypothetical protein